MENSYKINELPKELQEKIYDMYLKESGITKEEMPIVDFANESITFLGKNCVMNRNKM